MANVRVTAGDEKLLSLVTFFAAAKKVTPAPGRGSANRPTRNRDPAKKKRSLFLSHHGIQLDAHFGRKRKRPPPMPGMTHDQQPIAVGIFLRRHDGILGSRKA